MFGLWNEQGEYADPAVRPPGNNKQKKNISQNLDCTTNVYMLQISIENLIWPDRDESVVETCVEHFSSIMVDDPI